MSATLTDPELSSSDQALSRRVRLVLDGLYVPLLRLLEVEVCHGVVTLHGRVRNYYERQVALSYVRRQPGVIDVVDNIRLPRTALRIVMVLAAALLSSSAYGQETTSARTAFEAALADESALTPSAPAPEVLPSPVRDLPDREEWEAVVRRLETLEREQARAAEKKAAGNKPSEQWIDVSSEKWLIKLGGHVQMDWIHWPNADPPIPGLDYFEFRRLRLLADGVGYGVYDFRLQIDIEPEAGDGVLTPVADVKDAYLTMNEVAVLQRVRVGNFFVPFSLEQVTNDTNNIFLERSIPTQNIFAADREVGVAMYAINAAQDVTWSCGAFFDNISESLKERIDDNQGYRLSGRLTWLPYYDEPSKGRYLIHTGVGLLFTDDQDDMVRVRARPQVHEGPFLIDSGNLRATTYTNANVELATVWGQFSVQSELFISNVNLIAGDAVNFYGGYVYASYFLTGENRIYERFGQHGAQFGRNVPFTNFFLVPGCSGWGAWEAKARTSYLDLSEVDRGRYNDLTVGFNWYWTERIRVMFDWIHPWTSSETPFGATSSDLTGLRFDFNW
jgi:phosphate-selective porin OprO and OprP